MSVIQDQNSEINSKLLKHLKDDRGIYDLITEYNSENQDLQLLKHKEGSEYIPLRKKYYKPESGQIPFDYIIEKMDAAFESFTSWYDSEHTKGTLSVDGELIIMSKSKNYIIDVIDADTNQTVYLNIQVRTASMNSFQVEESKNEKVIEKYKKYGIAYLDDKTDITYYTYRLLGDIELKFPALCPENIQKYVWDKITEIIKDADSLMVPEEKLPTIGYIRSSEGGGYKIDTFPNSKIKYKKSYKGKKTDYDILYGENGENDYQEFVKAINSETKGISVLYGPPGTGKTSFIRRALNDKKLSKKYMMFVDLQVATSISMTNLMDMIKSKVDGKDKIENAVLIIEDADDLIQDRKKDFLGKNSIISAILNLSDGIFNDFYSIQFLLTHNRKQVDVDDAIKRKQRMIYSKEFEKLSVDESNAVLEYYKSDERVDKESTLGDIFHLLEKKNAYTHKEVEKATIKGIQPTSN